jgi:hypothetical protein
MVQGLNRLRKKARFSLRFFRRSGFFAVLSSFCRGFFSSFCVWKPFFRPPGTVRPYWAIDSIAINLLMRIRLCATIVSR